MYNNIIENEAELEQVNGGWIETNSNYVIVTKGDTLSDIARAHHVLLTKLLTLNPQIKNPNLIIPGQRIRLF